MNQASNLRDAWIGLTGARSYVLAVHERPDGDCLGAALAFARVLRAHDKDVTVLSADGVPENYRFLPDSESVQSTTDRRDFDMGILIDADAPKRAGSAGDIIKSAPSHAQIDHHLSEEAFGEIAIVDNKISSTCELVLQILNANEIAIDSETATLLLAGIIFDTGGFRYPNTSSDTLKAAAELVAVGANESAIAREVLENKPLRSLKLLGRALSSMQASEDGLLAWGHVSLADYRELGASDQDTEGIVNAMSAVKGPAVTMLFREPEEGSIRVSLRSRGGFDVNRVARVFEGGGHAAAAGCTVKGSLDQATARVIAEVRKWMES